MANETVLDSSALIALLDEETGHDYVATRLLGAIISTVNVTEVCDFALRHGGSVESLRTSLDELSLSIVEPDLDLALDASALLLPTRAAGLSLADRYCLALARRLGRPALTADRAWATIADAVDVRVELIR